MTEVIRDPGASPPSTCSGPWFVSGIRVTMDRQKWLRVLSETPEWEIAYIPFGDRTTEEYIRCTAHARLIAAAPDLHEAAREIDRLSLIILSAVNYADKANVETVSAALRSNRAAIAKAQVLARKAGGVL